MKKVQQCFSFMLAMVVCLLPLNNAQAQSTYSHGVSATSSTTAVLWFKPVATADWVDAHYNTGAAPQNIRMTYSASNARFEQAINASAGTTVNYSFTYALNGLAYDTVALSTTLGSPSSSSISSKATPSSSSVPSSANPSSANPSSSQSSIPTNTISNGVADYGNSAVIWIKPNSLNISWSDIHFNANSTGQQNMRMTYNANMARFEQTVAASTTSALNINYSFTYQTPTGAYDSAAFNYLRGTSSSSSLIASSKDSSSIIESSISSSKPSSISSSSAVAISSSAVSSSTSSICTQNCFQLGVQELGATATVWFKTSGAQPTPVILHYNVSGQGGQINPQMTFNASLSRWEYKISPIGCKGTLNYSFTYRDIQGLMQDSPAAQYVFCSMVSKVIKPNFAPIPGSYLTAQDVTLSTTEVGGVIHYTLDGSAPNSQSPVYSAGSKIHVSNAVTISALTVAQNGDESALSIGAYSVDAAPGALHAPTVSHASGTYGTVIRVSIMSDKEGAYIHYTLDGSTPTEASPVYSTPIEVKIDTTKTPAVNTTTINAIAVKTGWTTSSTTSATYTITNNTSSTWNGLTTFNVVNGTKGKYSDSQVYWSIIGKDWNTGKFVHVDMNGNLIPMSLGDNGQLVKNGQGYANYFYSLAQTKKITIPAINSARLLMSVGSPMYIWVNQDINGNIGYAGANVENPTDPNTDITFDFGEFAIIGKDKPYQGIFINTTRVDLFGFPVQLTVNGLDGFTQTVGEPLTETRDQLFARFINETPAEFHGLAQAPYAPNRIMAPSHASFQSGGSNANYLDDYISSVWEQYRHQNLTLNLNNGWPVFTGHVEGDAFVFTDGAGTYRINGKPTTSMAMLGNGFLDDSSGATGLIRDKQLQLQAQVCAALNRHVAHLDGSKWYNSAYFFPAGEAANYFTKFWHDHAINGLTYGFSYDDVGGYSPSIYTATPVSVTYTIGW